MKNLTNLTNIELFAHLFGGLNFYQIAKSLNIEFIDFYILTCNIHNKVNCGKIFWKKSLFRKSPQYRKKLWRELTKRFKTDYGILIELDISTGEEHKFLYTTTPVIK
ncbi:MAG: hypothetical protein ACI9AR_000241 [Flavobacteriaceae bacterium]|jgi:hypothetical protein